MKSFWSLILTLLFGITSAQDVRFFDTQDGLPSNLIYQIAQDTNGFIWIATPRGLCRFDGENFKTYTMEDGLATNDVFSVAVSADNKVWFGAKSKYQGYIENDSIHLFPNEMGIVLTGRYKFPYQGTFGFCPYIEDVCAFALVDSVWRVISRTKRQNENHLYSTYGAPLTEWNHVLPKKDQAFYYINDSTVQHLFQDRPTFTVSLSKRIDPGTIINRQGAYLTDSLFCYFYQNQYILINLFTGVSKSKTYQTTINKTDKTEPISHSYFNNQFHLRSKYLSIVFDQKGDLVRELFLPKDYGQSFISTDYWGNLWMTSNSIGLGFQERSKIEQEVYHRGENIKSLYLSGDSLYLATLRDSLCVLDIKTKQKKTLYTYGSDFYELREGLGKDIMALAGYKFGSIHKSPYYNLFNESSSMHSLAFKSFELKNDECVLVTHIGVIHFNKNLEYTKELIRGIGLTSIRNFNSTLYLGSAEGLKVLEYDTISSCSIPGLPKNIAIKKLKPYYTKYLFAATEGYGIFAIDGEQYFEIPATKGLSVENIFVENDTAVWLACQQGLYLIRFDPKNPSASFVKDVFFKCDGLVSDYVNDIAVTKDKVYAATDKGLSVLDKTMLFDQRTPLLYVDEIWAEKQNLTSKPLRFSYNSGRFTVKYGAICFAGREHINFDYSFDQSDWITTTSPELNFNDLKPGKHNLQIRVTDHHFNSSIKSLAIYVDPLWWQTLWFKATLILVLLILLYLLYVFTKNRIAKREKEKADFNQKLSSLELMALRSQMNPHFVFNSLGAIQYYIQENQLELSEKYLVKFSKLIRLFFEYSRVRVLSLKEEIELLDNYLNIEKMRFGNDLDFSISVDSELDIEESNIPSMLLQPLVENAINHGLFHKKGKGKVEIEFLSNEHNGFEVYIKDDGIGLKKGNAIRKSSPENYRSSSTEVIKENISLLNQQGEWQVNFKTKTRYPDKENSGTVVHLNFKLKRENINENQNSARR